MGRLLLLLFFLLLPEESLSDGQVVFFGEDGVYEVKMDGTGHRQIAAHKRLSDINELYPPAVGGLCVSTALGIVAWTENGGPALEHNVFLVEYAGGTPRKLFERSGEVLGCTIDDATSSLIFVEYYPQQEGTRAHVVPLSGTPLTGPDPGSSGEGIKVDSVTGGGAAMYGGSPFFTISSRKSPMVANSKFKQVDSTKSYTDWLGYIGYLTAQADGSAIVADSESPSEVGRTVNLIKVDLTSAGSDATVVWEKAPVCTHIGYQISDIGCLMPNIAATNVPGLLVILSGAPADSIQLADLAGKKVSPIYTGAPNEVGSTGLGPVVWVEETEVTPQPVKETEAPPPETGAPPMGETETPDTSVPKGETEAPPQSGETAAPPTPAPPPEPAPPTPQPVATPVPIDCGLFEDFGSCRNAAGCEWADDGSPAECVTFGSRCPGKTSVAECRALASCFWYESAGICGTSHDCANQEQVDCLSKSQCAWDATVAGCRMAAAEEDDSSALESLLQYVLIAFAVFCCLLILIMLCICRMKRAEEQSEMRLYELENGKLAQEGEGEEGEEAGRHPGQLGVTPEKARRLQRVKEAIQSCEDVVYSPPPIPANRVYTPPPQEENDDDSTDDLMLLPTLHSGPSDSPGFESRDKPHFSEINDAHHSQNNSKTERELELLRMIHETKQQVEIESARLVGLVRDEAAAEKKKEERRRQSGEMSPLRSGGPKVVESPGGSPRAVARGGDDENRRMSVSSARVSQWKTGLHDTDSEHHLKHQSTRLVQSLLKANSEGAESQTFANISLTEVTPDSFSHRHSLSSS